MQELNQTLLVSLVILMIPAMELLIQLQHIQDWFLYLIYQMIPADLFQSSFLLLTIKYIRDL